MKNKGERRIDMWINDPHCYYCGKLTRLPSEAKKEGQKGPHDMATLDHKFSRNHPIRKSPSYRGMKVEEKYVLACSECNTIKGRIENTEGSLIGKRDKAIRNLVIVEKMIQFESYRELTMKITGV